MQEIPLTKLNLSAFGIFNQWLLLTSGDFAAGQYNAMTISWGSAGVMWNKPFVMVVVRPTRHTFQFMEKYNTFSLCAFHEAFRPALELLGTRSGREGDKIKESGLIPAAASRIAAPVFVEADLVLECKKIYWDDYKPEQFLAGYIARNYAGDYHRIYFGEILAACGTAQYAG